MTFFARHDTALRSLETRGRYRQLIPRAGHDFASNDYLGLAESDVLQAAARSALDRGVPVGAGGSRLLRGNQDEHCLLEQEAATFFDTEAALFVGGGFVANTAIFATLPAQGDLVLYDALIHASTHDGMRLGRADTMAFAHNDVTDAAERIRHWREAGNTGQIWLACESLYSMDGDLAPIDDLATLATETDAVLVVDEAHATGVFGDLGRGVSHSYASRANTLTLHTCGKGLGVSGALICGAQVLIDTLINRARGFVFATAPSPLNAALVRAALTELRTNPARQQRAQALMAHAHAQAERHGGLIGFQSQIMPVIIGKDKPTMALAAHMQGLGYDIRGIRPPTVPRNTARLRISITLNTSANVVTQMMHDLSQAMKEHSQ